MKFILDGMLGKLSRWLRIMGYDALYLKDADDQSLVQRSKRERRVLLTSDVALYQMAGARGAPAFLVRGRSEAERIAQLAKRYTLDLQASKVTSRCPLCGTTLQRIRRDQVYGIVPERAYAMRKKFWACTNDSCGKIYWHGTHWRKIREVLKEARTLMKQVP